MMLAELINISKTYPGERKNRKGLDTSEAIPVLDSLSFSVKSGDRVAITGPSGSGKTTLLNILGTLDRPTAGDILIEGTDIRKLTDDRLAEIRNTFVGFVFQLHYLLPQLNLIDNVLLPVLPRNDKSKMAAARDQAMTLLTRVGLGNRYRKHPYQLSAGECQRAAVVRALINKPRMILADEPTGSLDAVSSASLVDLLISLTTGEETALVVVTHAREVADRMDLTYRLSSGKLIPGNA